MPRLYLRERIGEIYWVYRITQAWNGNACTGPSNRLINAIFWTRLRMGAW